MRLNMRRIPCVYMRGGTSKAVIFHEKDLPVDKSKWDSIFLKVMGSPDVKQIDGMGGTVSSTSKIAIIKKSERPHADVDYTFCQVDIDIANVDYRANCGNISSAVGPFAIDEGLVEIHEPITVVKVFNTNTGKYIEEHVRVSDGRAEVYGDTSIQGVPGTGSAIDMFFMNPGGATTGELLPTGNASDTVYLPDGKAIRVSIVDCSNAVVFINASDLGMYGTELTEVNSNKGLLQKIEYIRGQAAVACRLVESVEKAATESTSVPKVAIISKSQTYTDMDGKKVDRENMDICVRAISVGKLHKAYPMTVAVCTGAAAHIKGSIVHELFDDNVPQKINLGHASGVTPVFIDYDGTNVIRGGVVRTARRIMDGFVYIKE